MIARALFDLRQAARGLRHARGFTAAAVVTLVVGLTGTTVMYALVQGVLLRPLPVRDQDRIILAWRDLRAAGFTHYPFRVEPSALGAIRESSRTLERVAGVGYNGALRFPAVDTGTASYIAAAYVTGDFFAVLGVSPVLGRTFTPADDGTGAAPVLVITHGLWQRRYGGARDVIGRRVTIAELPFTIVGVTPPDLDYPRGVDAWRPLGTFPRTASDAPFRADLDLVARLRPDATIGEAVTDLEALTAELRLDSGTSLGAGGLALVVRTFPDAVVGDVRGAMLILFAAVGLVLLVATANVANLLLMRGESRRTELAVRAALGAGRWRLARHILTESLLLTVVSGALALVFTGWCLNTLMAFVPDGLPRVEAVRVDYGVAAFSVLLAFAASTLAGLAPAVSAARADLLAQLRGSRGVPGSSTRTGQRLLVVVQVALAMSVVAAAASLARTLLSLHTLEMGLAEDRLLFVELAVPRATSGDRNRHLQLLDDIVVRMEAVPGIAGATPVQSPPFAGDAGWDVPRFTAEGQDADGVAGNPVLNLEAIAPNYFSTVGGTIVRGRAFAAADRENTPDVAIVSEDVAAHLWPNQDPIGKRLKMGGLASTDRWRTVVGVSRPTRYRELATPRPTLYLPVRQFIGTADIVVVRTSVAAGAVAAAARASVETADPAVRVMRIVPFATMLDRPLARPRFNAFVLVIFGVAALSLAMVGLYAVMSAYVRQRHAEIGVRIALGATAAHVRRLVVGEGLRLAGIGAAIGLAGALAAGAVLRASLAAAHPLDPAMLAGTASVIVACGAAAVFVPVRRATRIDPAAVLRSD